MEDQQSHILVSVVYLAYPSSSTNIVITKVFHASPYDRSIEIKSNLRRNEYLSNEVRHQFTNNVRAAIQFRRER